MVIMPGKSRARRAIEEELKLAARTAEPLCSPFLCKRAREFAMLGADNETIAAFLGISLSTLERWTVEKPAFKRALSKGREIGGVEVVRALHRRAKGFRVRAQKVVVVDKMPQVVEYMEYFPPETQAARFYLTNKHPKEWQERQGGQQAPAIDLAALVNALHAKRGDDAKVIEGTATTDEAAE
jgi:hypothetical protein